MLIGRRFIEHLNRHYPGSARQLHSVMRQCRVPFFFASWYALNILYNITNKWALEDVRARIDAAASNGSISHTSELSSSLPITMGSVQFGVGSIYACILWVLGWRRPVPHREEIIECIKRCKWGFFDEQSYSSLTNSNIDTLETCPKLRDTSHIALYHTLGQICTVLSLSLNSIGFAHVIKAAEPFFSAMASRVYFGKTMNIRVYLALIPVVGGVIMAVAGSDEFSWLAFVFGMGSNVFFAMRAVVSKMAMDPPKSRHGHVDGHDLTMSINPGSMQHASISPSNLFGAVTCVSFLFSIPLVVIFEGKILLDVIRFEITGGATDIHHDINMTILYILSSGLFHYLNNEVMYLVLGQVHPITLAVGNTLKRVFIIISGVIVFSTPVTWQTAIGSTIGIAGVMVYSLMKQWYDTDHHAHEELTEHDAGQNEVLMTEIVETAPSSGIPPDQHLVSRKHISVTAPSP